MKFFLWRVRFWLRMNAGGVLMMAALSFGTSQAVHQVSLHIDSIVSQRIQLARERKRQNKEQAGAVATIIFPQAAVERPSARRLKRPAPTAGASDRCSSAMRAERFGSYSM